MGKLTGLVLAGVVLLAVAWWQSISDASITRLREDPQEFDGQRLVVTGVVGRSAGLVGFGIYSLSDDAGSVVYVVTDKGLPESGKTVTAEGLFKQVVAYNDSAYYVLLESENVDIETIKSLIKLLL